MPKATVKGALAMASKVTARDSRQLGKVDKSKAKEDSKKSEEQQEREETKEDDEGSLSHSNIERYSAASIKTNALPKQVEMEELIARQLEERLAVLKQKNCQKKQGFRPTPKQQTR